MKIASKISLSFIVLIVVFASIFTSVFYTIARNSLEDNIYSNLEVLAQSRADTVETFLDSEKESIRQLSKSVVIKDFLLAFMTGEAYQKFNLVAQRLKDTAGIMKYTYGVFVLDKNGVVVASSEPVDIGEDKNSDPYFLEGKKNAFIKDAYTSHTRKVDSIAFSAPIYDESNTRLLGVVVSRVRMTAIDAILKKRTGLGETGEVYLINRNGYMITPSHSMKDTFLKLKVDTENSRAALKHFTDTHEKQVEHKPSVSVNYRGNSVLGTHAIIPEMHWCLLAEIDKSEALAPLKKIRTIFTIISLIILLVAWPIGKISAKIITRPIHRLHEGIEIIGNGNLDYKVGTDSKDEIGQLSRAFDEMTEHLKKTTTSIDNLNKEIDKRQQTEETLRESEERYRQIVEEASDMVYRTDGNGYFTFGNPITARTVGYSEEEWIGKHFLELIRPDYRDEAAKFYGLQFVKKIKNTYCEYPIVRKDGTELWFGQNVQLLTEDDKIAGFQAVARDITNRRKIEEALQKSEETFRTISAAANDGIVMMNNEGEVTYWNEAAEKILGYTNEEILGKDLHATFVPERFLEAHKEGFARFKTTGQGAAIGKTLELAAVKKDGTEIPVELSLSSVKTGGEWNAIGLIRDITARKQAEEELQKAKERLKYLSYVDGLTEINNRRYFDEFLSKEWNRAVRNPSPLSLIMIDIDFFKNYNDTYGHLKGDECLRKIADITSQTVKRTGDFVARYGGEEFVVVLPDTDIKGASRVAEMIRANVETMAIEHNNTSIGKTVTVSLGVASTIPKRGTESDTLLAEADKGLYRAKQEGRNRVEVQR